MPDAPDDMTLEFLLDYTKAAPARQVDAAQGLDTKALQVFAAASVVAGLVAAGPLREGTAAWLYGIALCFYLFAAVAVYLVIRTRSFRVVDDADTIWSMYWNADLHRIRHALIDDIASAYAENRGLLNAKARWLRRLVAATALEVLFVGTAVLASLA